MLPPLLDRRMNGLGTIAALIYASYNLPPAVAAAAGNFDVLDYVDPFIGTANGGKRATPILVLSWYL